MLTFGDFLLVTLVTEQRETDKHEHKDKQTGERHKCRESYLPKIEERQMRTNIKTNIQGKGINEERAIYLR